SSRVVSSPSPRARRLAIQAGVSADSTVTPDRDPRLTRQTKGDEMKIVVIGGTGLIGSKLVERLRDDGHAPLAASPDTGVNTITGEGVAGAFEGAPAGVDGANAPLRADREVTDLLL